jgi:anthranilate synthase/aminodeoxychorismate synthase-like glutamine amidotransferase
VILVIDNYDSFTYNLVQYFGILGAEVLVVRNDQIDVKKIEQLCPERIVLSPGPGTPADAGICTEAVRHFSGKVPILGVCLGHQCIGEVFRFRVEPAGEPVHGKTSLIRHTGRGLFAGIPREIRVTRYHSLVLRENAGSNDLEITARTEDGIIMAVQHKQHPTYGVQFHPESICTEYGLDMLRNFLDVQPVRRQ